MVNLSTELYNLFDSDGSHIVTFLQWLANTYNLPSTLDVLDVGCGPGRILPLMAEQDWRVVAMEPNPEYRSAASSIADQYETIKVISGGFAEIEHDNAFDMVVAVNAPFSYLLTVSERVDALTSVYRALKPDGVLFLDMPNFLSILKNYQSPAPSLTTAPNGDLIRRVIEHDIDFHDCTFTHTDFFYVNDELSDKQVHKMSIITLNELQYSLTQTGFDEMMTFNGFGARENQRLHGMRMMVSARKQSPNLE